jgi:citronellol/citronellal dehydrogenase
MSLEKPDLSGSTAFITGTTRGIGKHLALALAEQGCNIVSTGKTSEENDYGEERDLEGTIEQTAREAEALGVDALPIELNLREDESVEAAFEEAVDHFGEVNIVVNNASAIQPVNVEDLPPNRFDLLTDVNVRGTYLTSYTFLDHLKEVDDAWLLTNAPPVKVDRAPGHAPYAWTKLGMSFITLSLADELAAWDVGCNTFWPVTAIDTRATRYFGLGTEDDWRHPEILSDTVLEMLSRDPAEFTGNAVLDEDFLRENGVTDFSEYNLTEGDPAPMSVQMFDPEYRRSE